jgi:hypothetical protein
VFLATAHIFAAAITHIVRIACDSIFLNPITTWWLLKPSGMYPFLDIVQSFRLSHPPFCLVYEFRFCAGCDGRCPCEACKIVIKPRRRPGTQDPALAYPDLVAAAAAEAAARPPPPPSPPPPDAPPPLETDEPVAKKHKSGPSSGGPTTVLPIAMPPSLVAAAAAASAIDEERRRKVMRVSVFAPVPSDPVSYFTWFSSSLSSLSYHSWCIFFLSQPVPPVLLSLLLLRLF